MKKASETDIYRGFLVTLFVLLWLTSDVNALRFPFIESLNEPNQSAHERYFS